MQGIIGTWKDDFWAMNPEFELISAFSHLKNKVGDERSGKLMWFIVYMNHQSSSLADLSEDQRTAELMERLGLNGKDIKAKVFQDAAEHFKRTQVSRPERILNAMRRKLDQIERLIEDMEMTGAKDVKELLEVEKNLSELTRKLSVNEQDVEEHKQMIGRGDRPLSAADTGELWT